ncbi:MAG TPA: hypothetical protein VN705_09405 [Steroidobacteraceae bacterium]|jgi:hypothetical protein|nr:hypothetical protein [Steroidobacteraceae bacterium]
MTRNILGVVAGLVAWLLVAATLGFIMRTSWPAYAAVAETMNFTLPMMLARLSIGALATLAAGLVTALITRSAVARLIPGVLLLVAFIPQHVMLWDKFPLWYHLTFLLSLVPLTYLGSRIVPPRN